MDSYAPCPCGSGKKVKFCCQAILPEMSKIERLQQNNQPRMALQLIDKLLKDHQENAWLNNQRAMALIGDERYEEARDALVAFLRKNPDHPLSNGLLALAMTELEPMAQCKKVIHRAFLKSISSEPRIVAILAGKLVDHFLSEGQDMAARQHMGVVLRLEQDEERERTLMAMLEMDAETSVPYPLRGAHPLPQYQPAEEQSAQFKKAQRLYVHACFAEAADLLDQIALQDANSPQLWHMIGLMRAWDGNEQQAAAALHRAAQLYTQAEQAIDVETIAQLLDQRLPDNMLAARARRYEVHSLARLLTRLDNEDRLSRAADDRGIQDLGMSAAYDILDRPIPPESELASLTIETAPRTIGQIGLFDRQDDGTSAFAQISALEDGRLSEATRIFEAAAGELTTFKALDTDLDKEPSADVLGWYSKDELALSESIFFPPKTPPRLRNQLQREFAEERCEQTWLTSKSIALNGKTPLEAAGDESLRVTLAAAVRVFDSFMDRRRLIVDATKLRGRLQLPEPTPLTPTEEMDLNTLSISQLQRLDLKQLSDTLFDRLLQRILVVMHCGLSQKVLVEFLEHRPQLVEAKPRDAERAYMALIELHSRSLQSSAALEWQEKSFQYFKSKNAPFEVLMLCKMRELAQRAADPEDPKLKEVLLELWNYYGSKMPAVRARLEEFVQVTGIEAPWTQAILTPQVAGGGGMEAWSADTAQSSTSEKKLWLPD